MDAEIEASASISAVHRHQPRGRFDLNSTSHKRRMRGTRRLVFLALILICLIEGIHLFGGRTERLREIYGGAFQVAHPEYYVTVDAKVGVGPLSVSAQVGAFELSPDLQGPRVDGTIAENVLGLISAPHLPEAKMSQLLRSFKGGEGVDDMSKSQAREAIADLPQDASITAIVELASPMTEDEINAKLQASGLQSDALYLFVSGSPEVSGIPVYWRPCAVYERECENTSSISLFRRWAAKLDWTDTLNLRALGLDIDVLRQAAHEGKIYGLLTYGYSGQSIAELIEKPEVRTIKVVATSSTRS
ncbi:hypothetical protein [Nonomuraea insulae]|uniref:Uncharacterized protein n=1 Tax=Nonomuraea insulae TaxID=1616787 RepID=A0ABW1CYP8_9ACTN